MISCIVCCRNSDISSELKKNIRNTIGTDYELVVIDNSYNKYSIFSAYNTGVKRAKGDILCFMHEDIEYVTNDWGKIVLNAMENKKVGCVGVAGSYFMPSFVTAWWNTFATIGQWIYQSIGGELKRYNLNEGIICSKSIPAVVVDGFWMCLKRTLFNEISFDEKTYNGGFHCYDLDICMQVISKKREVCVLSDLWIIHRSYGNVKEDFHEKLTLWYKKWKDYLPICSLYENQDRYAADRDNLLRNLFDIIQDRNRLLEIMNQMQNSK